MAKIDCSVTVNFLKEWRRMCDSYMPCDNRCPMRRLSIQNREYDCKRAAHDCSKTAVEIVQTWSDEHPQKTRLEDLLEKYPSIESKGVPTFCPAELGYCENCRRCAVICTSDCWNEPVDGGATGKAVE